MNKELIKESKNIEPILRIGKNGLTETVLKDIKDHLRKRKLIKVKFLRAFIKDKNKKEAAKEIADKTDSEIIQQIGFVIVLYKEG